jgi:hypothetical protein
LKKSITKRAGRVVQVVERLPRKHVALNSTPVQERKKGRKERRKEERKKEKRKEGRK